MSLPDAFFSVLYELDAPHRLSQLRVSVSRFDAPDPSTPALWEGPASALFASSHAVVADPGAAPGWSPVVYGHSDEALAVSALVLALDHVEPERADALQRATRDLAGWLYTAWEHGLAGEEDCSIRAILLPSRPLRLPEAERLLELAQAELGAGDPADLHRRWTAPCCPRERLALARLERRPGWLLDVDAALSTGRLLGPAVRR